MSGSSNISFTREETQSMVPMAGSFTSETNEGPAHMMAQVAMATEEASANEDMDTITTAAVMSTDPPAHQEPGDIPPTNEKPPCIEISQSEDPLQPGVINTSSVMEECSGEAILGNGKDAQHELEVAMAEEASGMSAMLDEPAHLTTEQTHSDTSDGSQQDFEIVENNGCS